MIIEIPDTIILKSKLNKDLILLKIALELFKEELITLGQASKIAGLHQMQFQKELAKRKIPIHYGIEEFDEDMRTLAKLDFS